MNKEDSSTPAVVSEADSSKSRRSSTEEHVQRRWQDVVKRRSFLKSVGLASAVLPAAGALLAAEGSAHAAQTTGKLPVGDVALLKFAAAVELIEADLWQQYNELGGINGGNPAYIAALQQPGWRYGSIHR